MSYADTRNVRYPKLHTKAAQNYQNKHKASGQCILCSDPAIEVKYFNNGKVFKTKKLIMCLYHWTKHKGYNVKKSKSLKDSQ